MKESESPQALSRENVENIIPHKDKLFEHIVDNFLTHFDIVVQKIIVISLLCIAGVLISRCAYLPLFFYVIDVVYYVCDPEKIPARIVFVLYGLCAGIVRIFASLGKKAMDLVTGNALQNMQSSIVEFEQENGADEDIEQVVQDLFWNDYLDQNNDQQTDTQDLSVVAAPEESTTTSPLRFESP